MSYCYLQSVGINFNLGFGPQPGNLIRSNIASASCLSTFSVSGPDNIPFNGSATYTLSVSLLSPKWSVTSGLSISYTSGNTAVIAATATTYTTAAILVNGVIVRTVTVGNMSSVTVGSGRQIAVSIAGETPAALPYLLVNRSGAVVAQGLIASPGETLDFHALPAGIYVLKVGEETHKVVLND